MSAWTLIQIFIDIFFALGIFVTLMRVSRAPKDDPRLSRGLQLLQSKIAVLEDLSDRTETQVAQLGSILEQKAREVQAKVQLAEKSVQEIRLSMERSLDVAKIFQDKIPHKEIIERQNTIKYVQAARFAHQGLSTDEIAAKVDLPKGEIEFIASVNRDRLVFSEDQLPAWATKSAADDAAMPTAPIAANGAVTGAGLEGDEPADTFGYVPMQFEGVEGFVRSGTPADDVQETAARQLRAEMELAENQRLVENLSRLQFEMQNLDMQLSEGHAHRDLSKVLESIESPKASGSSLERLGEEFRKAVKEAQPAAPGFNGTTTSAAIAAQGFVELEPPIGGATTSATPTAAAKPSAQVSPVPTAEPVFTRQIPSIQPHVSTAAAATPVLTAREKVQAALRAGREAEAAAQTRAVNAELQAARAMAKAQAMPETRPSATQEVPHIVRSSPKRANEEPPVIRRVQFPKISDTEY